MNSSYKKPGMDLKVSVPSTLDLGHHLRTCDTFFSFSPHQIPVPPPKDNKASDLSSKRHRRESDEGAQNMSSSDHDGPPPDLAAPTHTTRSSARNTANKCAKVAADLDTNASDEERALSLPENTEKSDAPAREGSAKGVSRTSSMSTTFTAHHTTQLEEKYSNLTTQKLLGKPHLYFPYTMFH